MLIAGQTLEYETSMRQLTLDLLPETLSDFDSFVVGSNTETLTALAAWLAPSHRETLFLLWGEAGVGKSHLLHASGAPYRDARRDPSLSDLDPEETEYAVDHVQALDASGQIALFHLVNRLRVRGGRLLLAADAPPRHLTLREDLRTRLGSGLVYRLRPLNDGEREAALEARARARGLALSPRACRYLLTRAPRDMQSLTALLSVIDRYSLEHQRPITLPLLRAILDTAANV